MDLEITKKNGEKYRLSDYGIVKDIVVESPEILLRRRQVPGRPGFIDYGMDYGDKKIKVEFKFKPADSIDYANLRDKLFGILLDKESYYVRELRALTPFQYDFVDFGKTASPIKMDNRFVDGTRYDVRLESAIVPEQSDNGGHVELVFLTSGLPFSETTYTTLDLQDSGYNSDFSRYGLVDNINVEQINYRVKKEDLNLLSSTDLSVVNAIKSTNNYLIDGSVTFEIANTVSGIAIKATSLKPNTSYTLKYDYQKIKGTLVGFGGHMDATWSNAFTSGRVDNKTIINYQGVTSAYIADDNNKHTVILHFKTGKTVDITHTIYIQPNRLKADQVEVKVSNLTLVEGDSETQNWSHSILDFSKVASPKITSQKFSIYNAGNATVEPNGVMYLKIFIMGLTTNDKPFIIRNITTNDEFILNKAGVGNNLLIDGLNVTLNNVKVLRDTNLQFISLTPGMNEFEILGGIYSGLYFDFRFYYK